MNMFHENSSPQYIDTGTSPKGTNIIAIELQFTVSFPVDGLFLACPTQVSFRIFVKGRGQIRQLPSERGARTIAILSRIVYKKETL